MKALDESGNLVEVSEPDIDTELEDKILRALVGGAQIYGFFVTKFPGQEIPDVCAAIDTLKADGFIQTFGPITQLTELGEERVGQ